MIRRFFKFLFITIFTVGLLAASGATVVGFYFYFRLTRDLPKIEKLSDYRPKSSSFVYAADGTLLGELFEERREPVKFEEIPRLIRNAFLAAEDSNFYNHPGIDFTSILRAVWVNVAKKGMKQGASTITQQVVKSLLLSREKTLERKAKEAILSYRLEKALSKDDIFSIYLNEIFLGNHAYGIKAAAHTHFHKSLADLSPAEAAFLAALPQRPSELMNPKNRGEAIGRQRYVLGQMLRNKWLTKDEYDQALKQELKIYPANLDTWTKAKFYTSHAVTVADEALKTIDRKLSLKNPGGFHIYTSCDLRATEIAERSLRRALQEVDKRRGWRGPLKNLRAEQVRNDLSQTREGILPFTVYRAVVQSLKAGVAEVRLGEFSGTVNLNKASWAKRFLSKDDSATGIDPAKAITVGQVIEVSLANSTPQTAPITDPTANLELQLDQTPEVEGAFVVNNIWTGEVLAIVGGYDYDRSNFNRATQGRLQPGSSFKPFIYVAALDALNLTPTSMVPDSPISLVAGNGKLWTPGNFDGKFLGPITLRKALEKSRNVVSVYLLNKIGVERGIQSARNLGITTPIDRNLSIALGTPEVAPLEMVRAYGVFPSGGRLAPSLVVKKIVDRDGKVIYEQHPEEKQVLSEESAFLMTHMMKGVVERGTATSLKVLGRPIGGKTGTTNDHMDAWFIGFTPDLAAGAWVGFDVKRPMGKQETGGKAAGPAFLYFMQEYLANDPGLDFSIPDGVEPVPIDVGTGRVVDATSPGAFIEYFKTGTEPGEGADQEMPGEVSAEESYLSGDEY